MLGSLLYANVAHSSCCKPNHPDDVVPNKYNVIAFTICIKRHESDVGHVVFEILAKPVFKFLCFILFLASTNPS